MTAKPSRGRTAPWWRTRAGRPGNTVWSPPRGEASTSTPPGCSLWRTLWNTSTIRSWWRSPRKISGSGRPILTPADRRFSTHFGRVESAKLLIMRWLTTIVILTLLITGVYFGINWFGGDKNIDKSGGGNPDLPAGVLSNRNATELDLSNNNLTSLPAEIGQLTKLEILTLDDNKLEGALPAEIRKMTNLRILSAKNNNLTGIPAEIGQLSNLETI